MSLGDSSVLNGAGWTRRRNTTRAFGASASRPTSTLLGGAGAGGGVCEVVIAATGAGGGGATVFDVPLSRSAKCHVATPAIAIIGRPIITAFAPMFDFGAGG